MKEEIAVERIRWQRAKKEVVEDVDPVRTASDTAEGEMPESVRDALVAAGARLAETGGVAPAPKGPPQTREAPSSAAAHTANPYTDLRTRGDDYYQEVAKQEQKRMSDEQIENTGKS